MEITPQSPRGRRDSVPIAGPETHRAGASALPQCLTNVEIGQQKGIRPNITPRPLPDATDLYGRRLQDGVKEIASQNVVNERLKYIGEKTGLERANAILNLGREVVLNDKYVLDNRAVEDTLKLMVKLHADDTNWEVKMDALWLIDVLRNEGYVKQEWITELQTHVEGSASEDPKVAQNAAKLQRNLSLSVREQRQNLIQVNLREEEIAPEQQQQPIDVKKIKELEQKVTELGQELERKENLANEFLEEHTKLIKEKEKKINELVFENNSLNEYQDEYAKDSISARLEGASQILKLQEANENLVQENKKLQKDLEGATEKGEKVEHLAKYNRELEERQFKVLELTVMAMDLRDKAIEENAVQKLQMQKADIIFKELEGKVSKLELENKKYSKEKTEIEQKLKEQETKNGRLQQKLDEEGIKSKQQKKTIRTQGVKLKFADNANIENKALKQALEETRKEDNKRDKLVDDLTATNKSLEKEVKLAKQAQEKTNQKLEEKEKRINELQASVDTNKNIFEEKKVEFKNQIEKLETENKALQSAQKEAPIIARAKESLEKDNQKLKEDMASLVKENQQLQAYTSNQTQELKKQTEEIKNLKLKAGTNESELERKNEELQAEIERLGNVNKELQRTQEQTVARAKKALEDENATLRQENASLKATGSDSKKLSNENKKLQQNLAQTKEELQSIKQTSDELSKTKQSLEEQLEKQKAEYSQQLEENAKAMHTEAQTFINTQWETNKQSLEKPYIEQIQENERIISGLQSELEIKENSIQQLLDKEVKVKVNDEAYQKQIDEQQKTIAQNALLIDNLQNQFNQQSEQIKVLNSRLEEQDDALSEKEDAVLDNNQELAMLQLELSSLRGQGEALEQLRNHSQVQSQLIASLRDTIISSAIEQSDRLIQLGDFEGALNVIDPALDHGDINSEPTQRLIASKVRALISLGRFVDAIDLLRNSATPLNDEVKSSFYSLISKAYHANGDYVKAIEAANEGLSLTNISDLRRAILLIDGLAALLVHSPTEALTAIENVKEAFGREGIGNDDKAMLNSLLSNIYFQHRDYTKAVEYANIGLSLNPTNGVLATLMYDVSRALMSTEPNEAFNAANEGLKLDGITDTQKANLVTMQSLALTYGENGAELAAQALENGINNLEIKDSKAKAGIYISLGQHLNNMMPPQYERTIKYMTQALTVDMDTMDIDNISRATLSLLLSEAYLRLDMFQEAISNSQVGLHVKAGDKNLNLKLYAVAVEAFFKSGDREQARKTAQEAADNTGDQSLLIYVQNLS